MSNLRVVVIAASADIGAHLVEHFLKVGAEVVGTYRNRSPRLVELEQAGASLFPLDITSGEQVTAFAQNLREMGYAWNVFVSAAGLLDPIGPFFSSGFDEWETGVLTNSTAQLRVLHAIHALRDGSGLSKIVFFAGGGSNGTFDNYSAYCLGKLSLIKMTELLDSECPDLQVSIIGTGWVNTKIHQQTLAAGNAAGINFNKTREFMESPKGGASMQDVAECVQWCLAAPRSAVGGRNFSLVHDQWRDPRFTETLIGNPGSHKLRRLS